MSLRRSLYKHYSRNSASSTSFLGYGDQANGDKHWVRDWYDPPKVSKDANMLSKQNIIIPPSHASAPITPLESTPQTQSSPSQSQTPQPVETYGFKVKTWVITEEAPKFKDCENEEKDTLLPLEKNEVSGGFSGESGLTEAEMKSAVGGPGVSNSLFSSSAAAEYKNGDGSKKDEKPKIEEIPEHPESSVKIDGQDKPEVATTSSQNANEQDKQASSSENRGADSSTKDKDVDGNVEMK
ncbi:hypothetical protein HII12_005131 [Brettanomyces bruxellensis]|uniref:Uncharacterized protein n=1 Tax=Dekkera bruxellensis TaxID=5007 RepID=A0A8H6EQA6_DEKBR|nr:hypothetical protein HII12_005131 [Brettanomyces bruxellensis]